MEASTFERAAAERLAQLALEPFKKSLERELALQNANPINIINKTKLMEILDCTSPYIDSLIAKGLPVIQPGGKRGKLLFNAASVNKWLTNLED